MRLTQEPPIPSTQIKQLILWRAMPALAAACAVLLAFAPAALAHAELQGTSPTSGATLGRQPSQVAFTFNEPVGGTLGAVRVFDAQGKEVDDLAVTHPKGDPRTLGVGLKPGLPKGTYTATYRVISADTHIVFGGLVFNIGHPSASSKVTVAGLIAHNQSGHVTKIAFGVTRALSYLAIAVVLGGLTFLLLVWAPAIRLLSGDEQDWQRSERAFAGRAHRLLLAAALLGALASALGFLLQGADAGGVSLWTSLKGSVLSDTLDSRFGWVWAARTLDFVAIAGLLAIARTLGKPLATASPENPPPLPLAIPLAAGIVYLVLTPALAGHPSIESPTGLFFPADVLHVLGASVWVGGIACLLIALPAATRQLPSPERTRLLLATLARFSPLALTAVVTIAATGVAQAYIDVRSLHGLLHSTYGTLLLIKTGLLITLIALGWVNRERLLPALRRRLEASATPGEAGVLARRTLRAEITLMLVVLGVTAALVSYTPPIDAEAGPFSGSTTIGAAELELTVEPAEVGPNTIHLYLINRRTGTQFTATKELTASASLPEKHIGPLALKPTPAGPGHYVFNAAVLSPAGKWHIEIVDRTSEFDEHTRSIDVPIR
ncbi:MAG TPA: CopD family protein [Solirubrobacteraceae bacterium]|nr:CopD family protein [Solirubrobacteraceae bacterium]